MRRRIATALAAALCAAISPSAACAASTATQPDMLPTGRAVAPAGQLTTLRAYPTGTAVTPDGTTALTVAGSLLTGSADTAPGEETAIYAVDTQTGLVKQVLDAGDAFQSILYTSDGNTAYVAGASTNTVHVLRLGSGGLWSKSTDYATDGYVAGLALAPDERTLWAAEPSSGKVVELDATTGAVLKKVAVPAPDQLVYDGNGTHLFATDWRGSSVSRIDVATGAVTRIAVGDHPTGIARTPDGRIVVADANDATLATIDPGSDVARLTSVAIVGHHSDNPNAVVAGGDGRIYVSLGSDDAVAVLGPRNTIRPDREGRGGDWRMLGLIPTAWYPDALALSPDGGSLEVVSARGLGHGPASTYPFFSPDPDSFVVNGAYATAGTLQTISLPGDSALRAYTRTVRRELAVPPRRPDSVVYWGSRNPIKHVIYITRENKTYDADLGDLHPGPDNGFVLFGQPVTPNLHALERTFSEAQNFYYPAWASTTGHMYEDAGTVSDIEDRSNGVGTLNDSWHDQANYPASGLLVEQALKAGLSVRTYNEELAQQSGLVPAEYQASTSVFPNYALNVSDTSREAGWQQEFNQFESGHCTGGLAAGYGRDCKLPSLEYVYLGEDHTTAVDKPGYPSIEAQVADNDYATGKLIDAVSHSHDWGSTVVIVVEDDPQGTGDASSAYHGFMAIASPWAKRNYISTVPYNLTSVVGAIDRILNLPPITDYAATNRPLDDLFTSTPNCAPYTADSSGTTLFPFTDIPGVPATGDAAHGMLSFAEPDRTIPALAYKSLYRQVVTTHELGSFANPETFAMARAAAAAQHSDFEGC